MIKSTSIIPNPWDTVLLLRKDVVSREPDIRPGVRIKDISLLALLKMAQQHPSTDASTIPFAPIEVEYGDNTYF